MNIKIFNWFICFPVAASGQKWKKYDVTSKMQELMSKRFAPEFELYSHVVNLLHKS